MSSERMQIVNRVVVVVAAAAVVAGSAAAWRVASDAAERILGGVASGAVVAYDLPGGCPEGWSDFGDGHGRVVIGSGPGYPYREVGGAAEVVLEIGHLPAHSHDVERFEWGLSINGNGHPQRLDVDDGLPYSGLTGTLTTSPVGEGEAHENVPPYIALRLCKKD